LDILAKKLQDIANNLNSDPLKKNIVRDKEPGPRIFYPKKEISSSTDSRR